MAVSRWRSHSRRGRRRATSVATSPTATPGVRSREPSRRNGPAKAGRVLALSVTQISGEADLRRIAILKGRIDPVLESTVEEIRFLAGRLRDPLQLLATLDGEPAGFGLAGVFPEQEGEPFAYAELGVAPDFTGHGVGGALYEALSEHVRALGKSELQLEVGEDDAGAIAFLEKRRYREVERQKAVALDLLAIEPVPVEPPAGVEVRSWAERADLAEAML